MGEMKLGNYLGNLMSTWNVAPMIHVLQFKFNQIYSLIYTKLLPKTQAKPQIPPTRNDILGKVWLQMRRDVLQM